MRSVSSVCAFYLLSKEKTGWWLRYLRVWIHGSPLRVRILLRCTWIHTAGLLQIVAVHSSPWSLVTFSLIWDNRVASKKRPTQHRVATHGCFGRLCFQFVYKSSRTFLYCVPLLSSSSPWSLLPFHPFAWILISRFVDLEGFLLRWLCLHAYLGRVISDTTAPI